MAIFGRRLLSSVMPLLLLVVLVLLGQTSPVAGLDCYTYNNHGYDSDGMKTPETGLQTVTCPQSEAVCLRIGASSSLAGVKTWASAGVCVDKQSSCDRYRVSFEASSASSTITEWYCAACTEDLCNGGQAGAAVGRLLPVLVAAVAARLWLA